MTHICVSKLPTIDSDNGLSPGRRQAIIWTNAGILWIGPLGTYFSNILTGIQTFSFKKMRLNMSSAKWRPFCLRLNVLNPNVLQQSMAVQTSHTKGFLLQSNPYPNYWLGTSDICIQSMPTGKPWIRPFNVVRSAWFTPRQQVIVNIKYIGNIRSL